MNNKNTKKNTNKKSVNKKQIVKQQAQQNDNRKKKLLAAVLPITIVPAMAIFIPSIVSIVQYANHQKAIADKTTVDSINKKIADSGIKFTTMFNLVQYLKAFEGIDLESLKASGDLQYVWDSDKNVVFTINPDGSVAYAPEWYELNSNKQHIWKMVNLSYCNDKIEQFEQKNEYAQYIRKDQECISEELKFSTSIDTGYNKNYNLVYEHPEEIPGVEPTKPIVNTNKCDLVINGSISDVDHYGNAKSLTIVTFDEDSQYNEYGTVDSNVIIKKPVDFVAKPASEINTILVENEETKITVECDETTEVPAYVGTIGTASDDVNPEKISVTIDDKIELKDRPDVKDKKVELPTKYHSGFGTLLSPYIISSKDHMFNAAQDVNSTSRTTDTSFYFKLLNDIDLENAEWTPIGNTKDLAFKGVFDGNDCTISNLKINQTVSKVYGFGLFGWVNGGTVYNGFTKLDQIWDSENNKLIYDKIDETLYPAVIKNLTLDKVNINVEGKSYCVAGLAGNAQNAFISNIQIKSGKICGDKTIGGIVGTSGCSICLNCKCGDDTEGVENLEVTANTYNIGGIVGMVGYASSLTMCTNNAYIGCSTGKNCTITSSKTNTNGCAGGIVGSNMSASNCIIDGCINNANVVATNSETLSSNEYTSAAGICGLGESVAVIANSTNNGNITISSGSQIKQAAGIVTCPNADNLIYKCDNNGNVSGDATVGIAGIAAGFGHDISSKTLNIVECTNSKNAILKNDNENPQFPTAEICSGMTVIKFVGLEFENVSSLKTTIDSIASGETDKISVTFEKCNVKNKTGTLVLPSNVATITSDAILCDNIDAGKNATSLTINIPEQKINITTESECNVVANGVNNIITIGSGAKIRSVSVRGEGSKVINNGNVTRTICIDSAASYGENNGTCANVAFGRTINVKISNDKTFVNNGTITGLTDSSDDLNSVIYAWGDATDADPRKHNIYFTNNGTIKYQNNGLETPASFFRIDALCIHIEMTCKNGSKLITDTSDKWYSIFNNSDSILFKYQSNATIDENGTNLTFDQLAAKSQYAKAEPLD